MSKKIMLLFIAGCILGAIVFASFYGLNILDTGYDGWLLSCSGDLTCEYVGWLFFRNSSWSFPIGDVKGLVYPNNISIIYNDSIPLLAIPFKLIERFLPETFQYWGIWGIMCLMLQGGLGVLILNKLTKNPEISCIGSLFFISSTVMLCRLFGHSALGGHFIILIAILLWLYKDKFNTLLKKISVWSGLGLLCVLVNIYFFPMIVSILFFSLIYETVNKKLIVSQSIVIILAFILSTSFFWWLFGGFESEALRFSNYGTNSLYGEFAANLNTFINPRISERNSSEYLKSLEYESYGDYEGYAYLGVGIIICLISGISLYLNKFEWKNIKLKEKKITKEKLINFFKSENLYIVLCCIFLMLLSLIPDISLDSKVLLKIPIPKVILRILEIFNTNGRNLWPVWYVIAAAAVTFISKSYKKHVGFIIVFVCVIIQFSDIKPLIKEKYVMDNIAYNSPLTSSAWTELASKNKKFFILDEFVNIGKRGIGWHEFHYEIFAIKNGLSINDTYTSKKDDRAIDELKELEWKKILNGVTDNETIYVFDDIPVYIVNNDILNVYVINDRIIGCDEELTNLDSYSKKIDKNSLVFYNFGETIDFTSSGDEISKKYKIMDWMYSEFDGTWTTKEKELLSFPISNAKDLILTMDIADMRPGVTAEVTINGNLNYTIDLSERGIKNFKIPSKVVKKGVINLEIITNGANSPYEMGESDDKRVLGFKIRGITISKNEIES